MSVVGNSRSGKLTAGAILCIVAGASGIALIATIAFQNWGVVAESGVVVVLAIITSAIAILGGYYALRRRNFQLAIIGGISRNQRLRHLQVANRHRRREIRLFPALFLPFC